MKQTMKLMNQKTKQTMKKSRLFIGAIALLFSVQLVHAQGANVEDVIMSFNESDRDLTEMKEKIDKAAEHPKTAGKAKTHFWRALTYMAINDDSTLAVQNPDAIKTALASFTKAQEFDTKGRFEDEIEANMLNVAVGLYNKGYLTYTAGDYDAAYGLFEMITPLLKYDKKGQLKQNNLTADAIGQMLAYCALGSDDQPKALAAFKSLIDGGSTDPNNFLNAAKIELASGDTTAALKTVAAGKELNETNRDLINTELDIYLKQGRSKELIDKLNTAIETDPGNTIYYFARALSYEGTGDDVKAEADYDKILEIDPTYYDASYNKGVMYLNKVATLADEMTEKNLYKAADIAPYETKMKAHYAKAIVQFENVFANNGDMEVENKVELAKTMRRIYAQLEQMDKYAEMKEYISANE